jgi:acetolactate synthase-1/2/3 large subunit
MKVSGADFLVQALRQEGVDVLFGFPGGSVIPLFDALYSEPKLRVVLTRHEQGAVHAADGYARSTGRTGVCIATSGPGATNTITGLATANFDSVPLVCLTGQVPRHMIGNDAFQEADTVGISRPVTKHNYLVTDRSDLPRVLKEAFTLASQGRPGPVLVDIPKDILTEKGASEYPQSVSIRGFNPVLRGHPGQIRKAAAALKNARKPLFYIGGGVHIAGAVEVFRRIQQHTGVPAVCSLLGIGVLPRSDKANLGMLGMHGTYPANMAVTHCDLLFAIGTRFDDRATGAIAKFAPHARIVHIDIDPAAIAQNVKVEIPIVGDARLVLEDLAALLETPRIQPWIEQIEAWKREHPLVPSPHGARLSPERIVQSIGQVFPDAIVTTEVGQNQMWAALYYDFKDTRTLLTSGGLGTMGYGFPAAIGAQLGNPGRPVIDIAGDGSIQMNIQELATAVVEELPVIVAILNNGYLGMVRQWQEMFCGRRYSSTCLSRLRGCRGQCGGPDGSCPPYTPDFVKLADAYGAAGLRVTDPSEVEPALREAGRSKRRPVLIDFLIEREANVWPMVPPGAGISEMVFAAANGEAATGAEASASTRPADPVVREAAAAAAGRGSRS